MYIKRTLSASVLFLFLSCILYSQQDSLNKEEVFKEDEEIQELIEERDKKEVVLKNEEENNKEAKNIIINDKVRKKVIGIEAGVDFVSCKSSEKDYIRGELDPYNSSSVSDVLKGYMNEYYFGIKTEIFSLNRKFSFCGGVRYSLINSSLGKSSSQASTDSYYHVLHKQEGLNTYYLRVKEMNQSSEYIGVPLDVKIYPFQRRTIKIFFKAGADLNFKLNTQNDVVFHNEGMEIYQDDLIEKMEQPDSFFTTVYLSIGFKLGKANTPGTSLEICVPAIYPGEENGLLTPNTSLGFQLNVQFPY